MKSKKRLIISIVGIALVAIIITITAIILSDKNKLTIIEKQWITNNTNKVLSINVVNDVNVFGNIGKGVFFDFLNDFSKEYNLEINPITIKNGESIGGLALLQTNEVTENDEVFYTDHYVVVAKENTLFANREDLANKKIGVLANNMSYIANYLNDIANVNYTQYGTREELLEAFVSEDGVDYVIVPLIEYLDSILENDYKIIYHLSDIKVYYSLQMADNDTFSNVLKKYYHKWADNLDAYFKTAELDLFATKLNISGTEIDAMRSITYNYGFVNNSPYEVIIGGNYGGIVAVYLDEFSKFADVEFNFTKYRNYKKFVNAINRGKVDLYYNYYDLNNDYSIVENGDAINVSIIAPKDNSITINSFNSLRNETVYVQENSLIASYLKALNYVKVETYDNNKQLKKLARKNAIIAIDTNTYNYYATSSLKNYSSRFNSNIDNQYSFKVKNSTAFYKLLSKYVSTLDKKTIYYDGIYNHEMTMKSGTVLGKIAQYFLYSLFAAIIIIYFIYRSSKQIKISKKIKKEDKMKFIDQLTSLKNRNYLNENINLWNNNKVYPQTLIVIDLNNVQNINDTLGYEEGDKQIMAAANILIKTQLDNSDIIRTDGNEFLIYLIGYSQKQVTNYIHKLNKEFNKLPYEYGAEFGYSMITDDIKTIEDAMNEATEEMKKQKIVAKED